ncbi:hypothetical protein BH09VER1_BH09VER1_22260 [soil metagenome]
MVTATLIFAEPLWLAVLPLLAVGGYFLAKVSRHRAEQKIRLFVSAGLAAEALAPLAARPRQLRFVVPIAVMGLIIIAAARPLTGPRPDHADRKGVDFVVALDVSKSMWAQDISPYRLAAVKNELSEWFKTMAGDRMGLVLFAGDAVIQAPITFDYTALDRVLKEAAPKSISKGGTNIAQSIEMATTLLKKSGLDTRALVILTDGENLDGDAVGAARDAHEKDGLTIFTVGVGTEEGSKVPGNEPNIAEEKKNGRTKNFIRNEYGTEVVSRLDERSLRAVATAGGGTYEAFQPGQHFFPRFRDTHLLSLAKSRKILNVQDYYEWFQIPVALALLLLMLEPSLTLWKRPQTSRDVGVPVTRPANSSQPVAVPVRFAKKAGRPRIGAVIILFFFFAQGCFAVETLQQKVQTLFQQKKPDEAVALVKQQVEKEPENLDLLYNYGVTLYQAGRFEDAIAALQDIGAAGNVEENLRTQALLQLGNAQFRLGSKLGTQPGAVLSMERALAFYDQLLALKSSADGRHNREAAIENLKKILRSIADDRLKSADDQVQKNNTARLSVTLKEAVDALDRMQALDPSNQALASEVTRVHQRLTNALLDDANKLSAETDKIEAPNDPKQDRQVLGRRNQAIDIAKQALNYSPNDQHVKDAIQEQQNKIADLLTKRAEEKVAPILAKSESGKDLAPLNSARKDLENALEAAPNHQKAKDLKVQVDQRLEDDLVKKGEAALAAASQGNNPRGQLNQAMQASENFQKAQEVNAESPRAKAGLEKLQAMLPNLHAAVAAMDLAAAKKTLNADDSPATKGSDAKSAVASAKSDDLKKAVGSLETAAQNYGRAVSLAPDDADFQKGLTEAQQLLSESRDALDKRRQADTASQADSGQPQNSDQGGPENNTPNAPGTQVYSPRPAPSSPTVTSGGFWNKKRDW